MKYKTQEFKGLDKEITELTGDKETSGTELNAVQIDCAMISPSISLALTWPLGQATHTRLPMALARFPVSAWASLRAASPVTRAGKFFFGASAKEIKSAIAAQPVSIAIQADQASFQSYKPAVLSSG